MPEGHFPRLALGGASWAAVALENARLYTEARQASRLKDEFLATLSHELRTPLNAILGYARMIRSGIVPGDKLAKAVATIERSATSLTQIVEEVLDVSRIISGKLRLNVQPVELADIVRASIDGVMPAADAKGLRVETALDPQAGPVSGDPERLQQIIWNLVSNAVKFTERGGLGLGARHRPTAGRDARRDDRSGERGAPDLRGVRVLVVDDDRDALEMVRQILEAAGADVSLADSAQAALETIGAVRPDVLVSDLSMPRMDGQAYRSG
jgi:signal transduction histidine kinase